MSKSIAHPLLAALPPQVLAALQQLLQSPEYESEPYKVALTSCLLHQTSQCWQLEDESLWGCLADAQVSAASLSHTISRSRMPTAERLYLAETESGRWKEEALLWKSKAETFIAAAEKKEAALRRHEAEQANEKPDAIAQFLELLSSQPEETWAEHLIGMGTSYEVPKLFRCAGKVRSGLTDLHREALKSFRRQVACTFCRFATET